jgi:hypothetical protein
MLADTVDGWVSELYARAGEDEASPPGALALARKLLGRDAVVLVPRGALRTSAALGCVNGGWRIYIRRGLPIERMSFSIAHEVAEWAIRAQGATEADCDALGAGLIAPRRGFLRAIEATGGVAMAAQALRTTESLAWLRFGEVTGTPLCLVAPATVRVRGRAYSWPADDTGKRELARSRRPGLTKARLRDDRRRTAVLVGQLPLPFSV